MLEIKKYIIVFFFLICAVLPAALPLFQKGFFVSDDGEWMIIRFTSFHQAFRDGQFPIRWLGRLNYEYGYPVANFLYPGFMYAAEVPKLMGFGFVDSIKIVIFLSLILSVIGMYVWLSRFFDRVSAAVGAIFYLYLPYHLFDIYKRGSVGEVLALAIAPFVLWQLERKSLLWFSLSFAFLLIAHNSVGFLFTLLIIVYILVCIFISKNKREAAVAYGLPFFIGIGLSAFFWIPALYDLKYTVFSQTPVARWQEYFTDIEKIGIPMLAIILLTGLLFLTGKVSVKKHPLPLLLFFILLTSLFFATSLSSYFWQILPVHFVQFPFRFLSLTILCVSFLAGFLFSFIPLRFRIIGGVLLLLSTFYFSRTFITPLAYFNKGDGYYATNMDTTTVHNEYMPKWVKIPPTNRPSDKVTMSSGSVYSMVNKSNRISFQTDSHEKSVADIHSVYFPGWRAKIDNKEVDIDYLNEKGIIRLHLPSGRHEVALFFTETFIRLVSDTISICFFIALLVLII